MERRLTTVMIADVVGYGRLSQIDEEGTRARFQADLREIFEPKITAYRGRLIKTMGDGLLVEFPSVVDALRCAVEAQQEKAKRNAAAAPGQQLAFRIGVNLGDVIVEGDDIHGDGVNIADRIQALAEPGGVAISGTAYDQVKAKLPVGYASLGEQKVKSIAEPVRVYRLLMDPAAAGKTVAAKRGLSAWHLPAGVAAIVVLSLAGAGAWWQPWRQPANGSVTTAADSRPSLVVLPFDNLSDDAQQGYLADGITEDLTTELARVPGLFVISRNSAFAYKDKPVQPATVAKELGVRYLLEGSIRRAGDDIRINAQLIDGQSSGHLWAERFDGAWKDVFSQQDQVVEKVAAALKLRLVAGPRMAESPGGTRMPAAYELYLHAYGLDFAKFPKEVASLLRQAVAIDPNYGQAWAELAWVYWVNLGPSASPKAFGIPYEQAVAEIKKLLVEAGKHPSSDYYQLMADLQTSQRRTDEAIVSAERAIALNPSDHYGYEEMSSALVFNGRAADARTYLDGALRVDPQWRPDRYLLAGLIAFSLDQFDEAIASLAKADPEDLQRAFLLAAAHGHLGHRQEAESAKLEIERLMRERDEPPSALRAVARFPFKQKADMERLLTGLRAAKVPDLPFDYPFGLQDRLKADQLQQLVFGHELQGHRPTTGEPYSRTTAADGTAKVSIGSSFLANGPSRIDSDFMCTLFDTDVDATCAAVFRNPEGTIEGLNEFVWMSATDHVEFSQTK